MNTECITLSSDEEVEKAPPVETVSMPGRVRDISQTVSSNNAVKIEKSSGKESSDIKRHHCKDAENHSVAGKSKSSVRKVTLTSTPLPDKSTQGLDSDGKKSRGPSENLRSRKAQSKPSGSTNKSGDEEDSMEDLEESFSEADKYKMKKLENMLKKVNKKIKELEKAEVMSSDDEEENSYIQLDKYRKRAADIYKKMCEISGKSADAERATRRKISFAGRGYPAVFRALERRYNKRKQFPDYPEVVRVVSRVNEREHLGHSKFDIPRIAQDVFTEFGQALQKLRMWDDYSIITEYLNDSDNDPALEDEKLLEKLNENKTKYQEREKEVLDEFARKQFESKSVENGHKSEDEAGKEEEEDGSGSGSQSRSESESETEEEVRRKAPSPAPSLGVKKERTTQGKADSPVKAELQSKEEPSLFSTLGLMKNQVTLKEREPSSPPSSWTKRKRDVPEDCKRGKPAKSPPQTEEKEGSSPKRKKLEDCEDDDSQDCLIIEETTKEDHDSEKENNSKLDHRGSRSKSPAPNNCLKINNVVSLGTTNVDWKLAGEEVAKAPLEKPPNGLVLDSKGPRPSETSIVKNNDPEVEKEMSLHMEVIASDDGGSDSDSEIEFRPVSPSKEVPKQEVKEEDDYPKILYVKNGPPPSRFITSSVICSEVITLD